MRHNPALTERAERGAAITEPDSDSPWRLSVAPMMQRTDRHFRYLARVLAPRARLYTEMITTGAVLHGARDRLLAFDASEHPLAVQLGGSAPAELARAARICADAGFDEVNLNCGCPSERVKAGAFGACLMRQPQLVADCVKAMQDAVAPALTVSVKTRLGVDELYSYDGFRDFVGTLAAAGCGVFQVHARKAWLSGLSPAENREIPPLEYDWVYRLKREMPHLVIVVNGGITSVPAAVEHVRHVDGIMLGRQAYADPLSLCAFESRLFGASGAIADHAAAIERLLPYVERELAAGTELKHIARHLLNLCQRQPGARRWRQLLTVGSARTGAGIDTILAALEETAAAARVSAVLAGAG